MTDITDILKRKTVVQLTTLATRLSLQGFTRKLKKDEIILLFLRQPSLWPFLMDDTISSSSSSPSSYTSVGIGGFSNSSSSSYPAVTGSISSYPVTNGLGPLSFYKPVPPVSSSISSDNGLVLIFFVVL